MDGPALPFIASVLHPSDFSPASEKAFAHALAVALLWKARLTILHAGTRTVEDWSRYPEVRRTLERWALLESGSERAAVYAELGVRVTKIGVDRSDPVRACDDCVAEEEPDLVVLATEGRNGLARWLRPSTAAVIARRTRAMTLFVPAAGRSIVGAGDGQLALHRILIPVDHEPSARDVLVRATRVAQLMGDRPVEFTLLHVASGSPAAFPALETPEHGAWQWHRETRSGDVAETILAAARDTDLIAMATEGRHGFIDAMRGSTTEQIVRGAPCPVLAVPAWR